MIVEPNPTLYVMLITSNGPVGEWGQVFDDAVAATAILDRWLNHRQVVTIRGDSYRRRDKRRSGLLQTAAAPTPITSARSRRRVD